MILLQRFFQICLFRSGPADVPSSDGFLKIVCLIYFAVGVLVSRVDHNWPLSLAGSAADTLLLLCVCWGLLYFKGMTSRFIQTATAMAGTGSIMGIIGLPIFWLFRQVEPHGQLTSIVLLFVLILIIWSLFVTAHIFRYALEIRPGTAALVTVLYTIISLVVVGLALSGAA